MKFREALNILKESYGDTASLSFSVTVRDGREFVSIWAHGNGKCVSTLTYAGALADLSALFAGDTEEPGKESSNG